MSNAIESFGSFETNNQRCIPSVILEAYSKHRKFGLLEIVIQLSISYSITFHIRSITDNCNATIGFMHNCTVASGIQIQRTATTLSVFTNKTQCIFSAPGTVSGPSFAN